MSSADAVITTTSTIAGILFIFIFIIFICTCRRKQKKKKRFLKKHGPDSQSIEGKGFFTKTMWIPFWKQRGHTFFQYKTAPEIPISDPRSHRYQTRRETVQYAPSASGDSRMYTNRAYEEDYVTDAHAFRNLGARQSSIIYDNARNSRTFGSEFIGKTNEEMRNNSVYSSVYSSHSEKRQYNSWSHEDHRKNGKMHSNAEERVTEKTVWVPAETEDVAVYQAVEKQRKDKTEVNMSKQKTEGNKYESAQNTNMASNINGNQSTHLSAHMLETNGELCPYCIHAHTEGRKLVHRVSNRKGNSVDNSSQTDFAYEIRSSVSTEETNINLKDVDQYTYASIQKGDNKSLTKTTLSQPLLKTTRIQYDGVGVSRKLVKTSESDNDERVIIGDKRKVWPSLEVGKRIQSETKQSVFGDGSSGMVSTGSEMHQADERTSQVILLKRMQSNSNYGTQGFGASTVSPGESDGDHKIKIIHGEDKSSISDIKVGETTLGNQQGSGATSTGMLEKEQSLFKNTLENNGEKIENEESTLKTFKKSIDGHVSSVQLPKTGQRSLIFIKASSDSSFMNANNDTKMSRVQDDNKEVSINVSVLRKAESETGAINEEEQLKRRGAEVQEQTLWFHGDSDEDNDQSDSTSSAMLEKTTNLTEYDKTGSRDQKDEQYEIITSWLPFEQGQEGRKTVYQLSEERKEEVEDSESFGFRQEGIQRSYIVTSEDRKIHSPGHNQYTEIYKREVVPFRYNTKGKAEYMGEEINVTSTQSFQEMNIRTKGNADEKNIVHTSLSTDKSPHSEGSGQGHSYSLKMERKIEIGEPNDARPHIYHVESSERL
ncbi:uncharacterized protein LOC134243582 [Saccostrea cucullata]|uniref:uncharacterized protein LOC134243582 n=1 Tax=Saccostrea cuccullata TaxID=36930 RepID=UPI002ED32214